jgi:hypothetical protein
VPGLRWAINASFPANQNPGLSFDASSPGVVRLALLYERPSGAMRQEATVEIKRAQLDCAP